MELNLKIILPRIFEFFELTFRFNSSQCFGIIKDELIFEFVFLNIREFVANRINKNNFVNYTQRVFN